MVGDTLTEAEKADGWQEHHLSDGTIRGAIVEHLRSLGYEVKGNTLHLYGYGDKHKDELSAFQGHIAMRPVLKEPATNE